MIYHVYLDNAGEWRWRLRASNGRIIADSSEGYINKSDCIAGVLLVKESETARVEEA